MKCSEALFGQRLFCCLWALAMCCCLYFPVAQAQVVLDGSVGDAGPGPIDLFRNSYVISEDFGELHGENLFHSFSQFDIAAGQTAFFGGPATIANVISRITGGAPSSIDGRIRSAFGETTSFWLINPAGLMFGPNAELDLAGSIFLSTADYIEFADGGRFDASVPANSILTVAAPSEFGFISPQAGSISFDQTVISEDDRAMHQLSIVAGDITMNGALLEWFSGDINLVSVTEGNVLLGQELSLAPGAIGGSIALENTVLRANAGSNGESAGNIYIRGGELLFSEVALQTQHRSGEAGGGIFVEADALLRIEGDGTVFEADNSGSGTSAGISLVADEIIVDDSVRIESDSDGSGPGGDITLSANIITLNDETRVGARARQDGVAGNIIVTSEALTMNGFSALRAESFPFATGDAGTILIDSDTVSIVGVGATVSVVTRSAGNGGSIIVNADSVVISGITAEISAKTSSTGTAGDVELNVGTLTLVDGGAIRGNTESSGRGGNIEIVATGAINIDDAASGVFSTAISTGDGGVIQIVADNIRIAGGGAVSASSTGAGNAGGITIAASDDINIEDQDSGVFSTTSNIGAGGLIEITAANIRIAGGSVISASSAGAGDAGSITIAAVDGIDIEDQATGVFSTASDVGAGGVIAITADSIRLTGGAISASSTGAGNAGGIEVSATNEVNIEGPGAGVFSTASSTGQGGSIEIMAGNMSMAGGGAVSASSFGAGNAGGIAISATDGINISNQGSGVFSTATGTGDGGSIDIAADDIRFDSGGAISTSSTGPGNAGSINVQFADTLEMNGGFIDTAAISGDGGDIDIVGGVFTQLIDSRITTSVTSGVGDGGNIRFSAEKFLILDNGRIQANTFGGTGGDVFIDVGNLVASSDSIIEASAGSELGVDGNIIISSPDVDISAGLTALDTQFKDSSTLLSNRCQRGRSDGASSFVVAGPKKLPPDPNRYLQASETSDTDSATHTQARIALSDESCIAQNSF